MEEAIKNINITGLIITIITFALFATIIYFIFAYLFFDGHGRDYLAGSSTFLDMRHEGRNDFSLIVPGSKLPRTTRGGEYTISFWLYVNDWTYKYGQPKAILFRGDPQTSQISSANGASISTIQDLKNRTIKSNPLVYFYPTENKIAIRLHNSAMDGQNTASSGGYSGVSPYTMFGSDSLATNTDFFKDSEICDITNIRLQRWTHIAIVANKNIVDVYVDGKLFRTCQLPGLIDPVSGDMHLGAFGGFGGYLSRVEMLDTAVAPDVVYNMYTMGPTSASSWFSDIFNVQKMRILFGGANGYHSEYSFNFF